MKEKFLVVALIIGMLALTSCNSTTANTSSTSNTIESSNSTVVESSELTTTENSSSQNSNANEIKAGFKTQEFSIYYMPLEAPTADYVGSGAKFSMDIPSNWNIGDSGSQYLAYLDTNTNSENIIANIQGSFAVSDKNDPFIITKGNASTDSPESVTKEFTLNDRPVFLCIYNDPESPVYSYSVDLGDGLLSCEFTNTNDTTANVETYEQILSSIKMIEN